MAVQKKSGNKSTNKRNQNGVGAVRSKGKKDG
jgi:hypothetical protein